jgi:hypothetical protein
VPSARRPIVSSVHRPSHQDARTATAAPAAPSDKPSASMRLYRHLPRTAGDPDPALVKMAMAKHRRGHPD